MGSVAPDAVTFTDATLSHDSEPPVSPVGSVGAVRSIFTVLPAPAAVGVQADAFPALSVERNCTSVWPSALVVTDDPLVVEPQLTPLLVDVRYW